MKAKDKDDVFTDSMTSHITASDSSEFKKKFFLLDESLKPNQDTSLPQPCIHSNTESQFSSSMPYLESSDQSDVSRDSISKESQ